MKKQPTTKVLACNFQLSRPISETCLNSYLSRGSPKAETAIEFWLASWAFATLESRPHHTPMWRKRTMRPEKIHFPLPTPGAVQVQGS